MPLKKYQQIARKAIAASPDEWRTRAAQAVFHGRNACCHRLGLAPVAPDRYLRSLRLKHHELVSWWAERPVRWFAPPEAPTAADQQRWTQDGTRQRLLERAEHLLAERFPLFSLEPRPFRGADRWHTDLIHGTVTPRNCYTSLPYLDFETVGDSKFVWEPNRFGWIYWLLGADYLHPRSEFPDHFRSWTHDWFEQNPYPSGINYCSALEIAIRNYAWLWALHGLRQVVLADELLLHRLLQAVWTGCHHLQHTLSHYFAPNTHLIGEAFALYVCGLVLPDFQESRCWRDLGRTILLREAELQLHRDGTHRELSTCYHLYTTDFYVHAALLSRTDREAADTAFDAIALRLADRLSELTPLSGTLPQLNDCDGGRLTWFGLAPLDSTSTLRAADQLRADNRSHDHSDPNTWGDHLWLRLPSSVRTGQSDGTSHPVFAATSSDADVAEQCTPLSSDSGLIAFRNAAGDYLLFRSGPFGYLDCGHSHDGPCGVQLHLGGQPILVDSGTGAYTQSLELRNAYRGATGCNTVLIDELGAAEPDEWFTWRHTADADLLELKRTAQTIYCRGRHTAFSRRCGCAVWIERSVMIPEPGVCVILDRWQAERPVRVTLSWLLAPELSRGTQRDLLHNRRGDDFWLTGFRRPPLTDGAIPEEGTVTNWQVASHPYSRNYGSLETTHRWTVCLEPTTAGEHLTIVSRLGPGRCEGNEIRIGDSANPDRRLDLSSTAPCERELFRGWGVADDGERDGPGSRLAEGCLATPQEI